mgnify:CR=1 FL=1
MTLYIILTLSLLLNFVCFWYFYNILKKHAIIFEITDVLLINLENFSNHLKSLYELETYYGDETLKELIKHSSSVVEEVEQYRDMHIVFEEPEEEPAEELEE